MPNNQCNSNHNDIFVVLDILNKSYDILNLQAVDAKFYIK